MTPRRRVTSQLHGSPPRRLSDDDLNRDERRVLATLRRVAEPLKLREIARHTFLLRPNTYIAGYRTRNALRRLVRERMIEQVARGEYQVAHATEGRPAQPTPTADRAQEPISASPVA